MSLDTFNFGPWVDAGQTLALIVMWLRKPGEDATKDVGKLMGRVDVIEERVKHMPTTDQLRELEGDLSAIKARLEGMDDTAKTTRASVQRIEDFLRENR